MELPQVEGSNMCEEQSKCSCEKALANIEYRTTRNLIASVVDHSFREMVLLRTFSRELK